MKLFIYEHITSGALINTALPASLEREGNMMLHAIVEDFLHITGIEIIILRDGRLGNMTITKPALKCLHVDSEHTFQKSYNTACQYADFILPIAPETDGILFEIQHSIETEKLKSLGSQASAIAISTDKYQCYQILQSYSIPTPRTILASEWPLLKFTSTSGYIAKPRDGAGCVDTSFFPNQSALSSWLKKQNDGLDKIIIQPYIVGISISFSLLCSEHDLSVLSINRQHISESQGTLSLSGCTVNGLETSEFTIEQASMLAQKVHQAVAGLWGFIGIDVVVTESDVVLVDINPRLTTSYIALHESLQTNPAQLLLTMMNTNTLPTISHRQPVEVLL